MASQVIPPGLGRKVLAVLAERGLARALALVGFVVAARHFGAADLGQVAFATALAAFFVPLNQCGLGNVLLRFFDTPRHAAAVALALRWRLVAGVACAIMFPVVYAVLAPEPGLPGVFVGVLAASFLLGWLVVGEEWRYFRQDSRNLMAGGLAGSLTNLVVRLGVVVGGAPAAALVLAPGAEAAVKGWVHWRGTRGQLSWRSADPAARQEIGREFRVDGFNLTITALSVSLLTRLDLVMLGRMAGPEAAGVYSVAVQLADVLALFSVVVARLSAGGLVAAHAKGEAAFLALTSRLLAGGGALLVLVAVVCALTAPWLLPLIFGTGFSGAATPLAVLAVAQVFVFVGSLRGQFLALTRQTGYGVWSTAVGLAVNAALNVWAIPRYGVTGAAAATCLARVLMSAILPLFLPGQRLFNRALGRALMGRWGGET